MTFEEIYVKKIENAIRGLKLGTKTPNDIEESVENYFNKLRRLEYHQYEELLFKWFKQLNQYERKNQKKKI